MGGMVGLGTLRRVARELRRDVAAAHERDPAARGVSSLEVLAAWPGVHALLAHRVAHALDDAGVPLAPRAIALVSRAVTGIEIHPAARVGEGLFIDHGTGVVIGETADVGENATVVGVPGHPVRVEGRRPEGPDADWAHLPDPVADAVRMLSARVAELERRLAAAEGAPAPAQVVPLHNRRGPSPAGG
jgi:serine O-acetyltransferase